MPSLSAASSVVSRLATKKSSTTTMADGGSDATHRRIRTSGLIEGFAAPLALEDAVALESDLECNVELVRLLSFVGCPSALRASRLTNMMRCGAAIYANSAGSAATYDLSEVVDAIEDFISHNWAVPRKLKFIALALYFNTPIALGMTLVVAACLVGLAAAGRLPISRSVDGLAVCFVFRAVLIPIFLITMVFCRDWLWYMGHRGGRMFLDKTCIHQTDRDLQMQGIEKLGAFLKHSKRMVVIYTDLYLQKIWTVYEVAAFLSVHRPERMVVLPTSRALTFLLVIVSAYAVGIASCVGIMLAGFVLQLVVSCVLYLLLVPLYVYSARRWARDRRQIMKRVSTFQVRDCLCFVEADREVVYGNIVTFLRASGHRSIAVDATNDAVLDVFNTIVRSEVLQVVWESLGGKFFTYGQYILVGAAIMVPMMLDAYAVFAVGMSDANFAGHFAWFQATWLFGVWPVILRTFEISTAALLDLHGCEEFLFVAAVSFGLGIAWLIVFLLHALFFFGLSMTGNSIGTLLCIITSAVFVVAARCMCGPRCCRSPAPAPRPAAAGGSDQKTIGKTTGEDHGRADAPQPAGDGGLGSPQPTHAQPTDAPPPAEPDCPAADLVIGWHGAGVIDAVV